MRLSVIAEFCAFLILFHLALDANAEWKNLIKVTVPEGQPKDYVVYNELPFPTGDEKYTLLYAQKGDSLDKVVLFQVSSIGVITTVQPLIYEKGKTNKYDLTIVRRSSKETNGGLATTVRVTVQDVDNFPPVFAFSLYNGTIKENSPAGTTVMGLENCHAEDRDKSGIKAYKIIKGNERGYLEIWKYDVGDKSFLQLKATNRPIKRGKTTPFMTLVVEAEDMRVPPLTARTTIGIKIEEVNDHTPVFDKKSYAREISEDTPLMMQVLKVQASDEDEGISGEVYYFFQTLTTFFTINAFTGVITLVRELDYSKSAQRLHRLTVVARDAGVPSKQTSATVTITVPQDISNFPFPASQNADRENTAPFFPKAPYHFTIHTSFPVKGSLGAIFAVDEDPPGPNSELRYTLVSGGSSGEFNLDTFSGVLTVNKELAIQTYTLSVRAQDQGTPGKFATAQVKIDVEYVDNPYNHPTFSDPVQAISVKENTEIGKSVFRASVISDSSSSKGIVYSAIFGSAMPYFKLDEATGVLKTAAPLDREKHEEYDLMIEARNKEKIPRHCRLYLVIDITDVDDTNPDFTKPVYDASVPEGSPEGAFVTVIHAIDQDNPSVSYDASSSSEFKIEASTGVIRTKRVLDRATGDRKFLLHVTASDDQGKTSNAIVNINVTSAHDSAPKFELESYRVSLREGQGKVENLLCIAATGSNGPVKYSIKSYPKGKFEINEITGRLTALKSFDYKLERSGYQFQAVAQSESSPQTSTASITVLITNENGPPVFTKNNYEVTTQENVASGTRLLVSDENGDKSGFRFSVEEDSSASDFECTLDDIKNVDVLDHFQVLRVGSECQLQVIKNFIQLPSQQFEFQVRVTNVIQRNLFGNAGVAVKVTDTNDFAPEFTQSSYWVSVASDTHSGTSLAQVTATDRDTPGKADFVYELLSEGNPEDRSG
ncbi:protocadherin-like protein [Oculina patagonica]